ncbi:MAG: VCBS repeat-containing protein [Saprospiraceae bacterium]
MKKSIYISILFIAVMMSACTESIPERILSTSAKSFEKLHISQTKIDFNNEVNETDKFNHFTWISIYNGGGVSIMDINNDGLQDVFFTATVGNDALYLNKGNMVFEDITKSAGVQKMQGTVSSGISYGDVNQDGYLDIYVSTFGYSSLEDEKRNRLYINNGDLTFTESAKAYGVDNGGYTVQSAFFDYDNDNDLDLFVMNQPSNVRLGKTTFVHQDLISKETSDLLFRNDGNKFTDVSSSAGIESAAYGLGLCISDINQDGYQDIYIANDYEKPDCMYLNNGNGTFTNTIDKAVNHMSNFSMGMDIADINNDGLLDIGVVDMAGANHLRSKTNMPSMSPEAFYRFVDKGYHYQYMHNTLQLNNGDNTFSDISHMADIAKTDWSWSLLMADFDNDTHKDIYISNGVKRDFRNNDYIQGLKESQTSGVRSSILEIINKIPSTPMSNYMFHNDGNYHFENVAGDWGLGDKSFSQGAAYGDLDNDGDLDLIVNNMNALASVYENKAGDHGSFIRFKLVSDSYKPMQGSSIKITTAEGEQYAQLNTVKGFLSSSENVIHFGLGDNSIIKRVEITWPNNTKTILTDVAANKEHTMSFEESEKNDEVKQSEKSYFSEIESHVPYVHQENNYDDYASQSLLPYKLSEQGPFMSTADVDGDGDDDLYIGGSAEYSGQLFIYNNGKYIKKATAVFESDKLHEDMRSIFFDYDNDGDQDLYVCSGGNEYKVGSAKLQDRLYINDGKGSYTKSKALPRVKESSSTAIAIDVDADGDQDLVVFSRLVPGKYPQSPSSHILMNEGGQYIDQTEERASFLNNYGMVTDAIVSDYDGDGDKDILTVGEWMSPQVMINNGGTFSLTTTNIESGLYFSIAAADMDADGDDDYLFGNIGTNNKYKASKERPFRLYSDDFDNNGKYDVVLASYFDGKIVPVRGKECSTQQVPYVSDKFKKYEDYANASIDEIYDLEDAQSLVATSLKSVIALNSGGKLESKSLPIKAQMSPINGFVVKDVNGDNHLDIISVGNLYSTEVETTRYDAGTGTVLINDGKGNYKALSSKKSGMNANADAKDIILSNGILIVSNNSEKVQSWK